MFASREEAGKLLGEKLRYLASKKPVVLGITRGGVVVAAEVAKILKAPLYPLVIKKISSPFNPEFALGAMGPGGIVVGELSQISKDQIQKTRRKIQEKMQKYGAKDLGRVVRDRTVVIVDDGVATGWTLRAAVDSVRGKRPNKVIVAVPVADREIGRRLGSKVDSFLVLEQVDGLGAVGSFYKEFLPVSDEEVVAVLKRSVDNFSQR